MKNQKGVSLITLIITIIVVIILAVIVLRSGASDAPDQAAFSGFTKEMGELQDAVSVAMLTAKGNESVRGNQRSEAQLYNFVARGGYAAISGDASGDELWLIQAHAKDIPCTLIRKDYAEESIGMELPERKVETFKGTNQEVSYFVTPKGNVFCWPPYVYDGKSYVNADLTVKSGDGVSELEKVEATKADVTIKFDNGETVKVSNGTATATALTKELATAGLSGDVAVWYPADERNAANLIKNGVATGFTFDGYKNK